MGADANDGEEHMCISIEWKCVQWRCRLEFPLGLVFSLCTRFVIPRSQLPPCFQISSLRSPFASLGGRGSISPSSRHLIPRARRGCTCLLQITCSLKLLEESNFTRKESRWAVEQSGLVW